MHHHILKTHRRYGKISDFERLEHLVHSNNWLPEKYKILQSLKMTDDTH